MLENPPGQPVDKQSKERGIPMIFGAVLAGGTGSRMKSAPLPKQFLLLGDKPIILCTLAQFLRNKRFDAVYIAVNGEWLNYFQSLLTQYGVSDPRLRIVAGGSDRNETLMNVIRDIKGTFGEREEDVIITHDAVRPFVSQRLIDQNIDAVLQQKACDTAIPAVDTILSSQDGETVSSIPPRRELFQSQTPQSFPLWQLWELYKALSPQQKAELTDACKIFVLAGKPVRIIQGDVYNLKITTDGDYQIAQAICQSGLWQE